MVVFIASSDFNPNPRMSKYIDILQKKAIPYLIIGWDRNGKSKNRKKKGYYYFQRKAKYGQMYNNIINKAMWMYYVLCVLSAIRRKIKLIHAADFDSAFPAWIFCIFFKKKMIFDIFDWVGNSDKSDPLLIRLIEVIENKIATESDAVIICELERICQISTKNINQVLVFPNIPNHEIYSPISDKSNYYQNNKYDLIVSYVGVFDFHRGIENLIKYATENNNILLLIAGYGALETSVKVAGQNKNIQYFGKVEYKDALSIISASDLLYGCYHTTNKVHKYAAPNKFYESLLCATPIITTKNTLVGKKVVSHNCGFSIGESFEDLRNLFKKTNLIEQIQKKSYFCAYWWENYYKYYVNRFMDNEYIPLITRLMK